MTQTKPAPAASPTSPGLPSAAALSSPSSTAQLFDYRQAANPIRHGLTEPIPDHRWGPELHASGPTAVLPP